MHSLVGLAVTFSVLGASPESMLIEWSADYGASLATTRANDRPLLVQLERPNTGSAEMKPAALGESLDYLLLAKYDRCRIDVTTEYGAKVAKVFQATRFPSTVIIDRTGRRILFRKQGHFTPSDWSATLARYADGRPHQQAARQGATCFT